MPDLIHITSGLAQKCWPEVDSMILAYWLASRPDSFGLKQLEPNWIWAGFAKYDSGRLWKNEMEPERGKLVIAWLHSARTRPDDFWTLACFQTRSIEPKSDHTIQISCRLDLVQYDLDLCRKNRTESDALTGRNQNVSESDPAHLLGIHMEGYMFGCLNGGMHNRTG